MPPQPRSAKDTGLGFGFLVELVAKTLFHGGRLRLAEIAARTRLGVSVLDPVLAFMRSERLCEVGRRGEAETDVSYGLTQLGMQRADDFMHRNRYAGPAPVALQDYVAQVRSQSILNMPVTREAVHRVFSDVALRAELLDQFGAAMNSGRAMFLYGPAGSGKTFIAERLVEVLADCVCVPHAIVVDNEVIQVYDPLVHKPMDAGVPAASLDRNDSRDARWVPCHRPVVVTGGELTLSMLDLDFDEGTRYYHLPPQVKANNGLLIIDDLGRQLVAARDLLNRWIVPLDRRVDYLALHTGKKFAIPFDVKVIFSTNLTPAELCDDAFLRRLGYKIYVGALDEADYRRIFRQVCEELAIPYAEDGVDYLLRQHHGREGKPLLACIPRDILAQLCDRARYQGVAPELSETLLDWAWNNYFAPDWHGRSGATTWAA